MRYKYGRWLIIILGCFVLGLMIVARGISMPPPGEPRSTENKISIVTSFYPLFYFASRVAGENALVSNITPAGSEPHDYEPTPQDMARIERSDLLVLNGIGLESWGDSIRDVLKNSSVAVVTISDMLADRIRASGTGTEGRDPHVWLNPTLATEEVRTIQRALEQIDPASKTDYEKNAQALIDELSALDRQYREGLRECKKKDIITSHAAFGYLADEYGFGQIAITGLSPDAEPTPKKLAELSDFANRHDVRTIFFETLVSPKLAQTLAKEIGAEPLALNPLEGLSNEEISQEKNYLTEMENNLTNLKIALQCP